MFHFIKLEEQEVDTWYVIGSTKHGASIGYLKAGSTKSLCESDYFQRFNNREEALAYAKKMDPNYSIPVCTNAKAEKRFDKIFGEGNYQKDYTRRERMREAEKSFEVYLEKQIEINKLERYLKINQDSLNSFKNRDNLTEFEAQLMEKTRQKIEERKKEIEAHKAWMANWEKENQEFLKAEEERKEKNRKRKEEREQRKKGNLQPPKPEPLSYVIPDVATVELLITISKNLNYWETNFPDEVEEIQKMKDFRRAVTLKLLEQKANNNNNNGDDSNDDGGE